MKIIWIPVLAIVAVSAGIGGAAFFDGMEMPFQSDGFEEIAPPVEISEPTPKDPALMEDSLIPIWMALPLIRHRDFTLLDARVDYLANGITYRLNYTGPDSPDLDPHLSEIADAFSNPLGTACKAIDFTRRPDVAIPIRLVVGDYEAGTEIPAGACSR